MGSVTGRVRVCKGLFMGASPDRCLKYRPRDLRHGAGSCISKGVETPRGCRIFATLYISLIYISPAYIS